MKAIVSGGAGFIGSHLCEKLLDRGDEVICIDNFITGDYRNIKGLIEKYPKNFRLIEHDITLPIDSGSFVDIDWIFHLACPASPVDYAKLPLQTLWVNAAGTKNMLELANRFNAGFFLASSSEVYGDPEVHPQHEEYLGNVNQLGPRSCYTEGKRFAETLAVNYFEHFQFPLVIARIFNVYGPRMRKNDGRVVPSFLESAMNGEPLSVYGNGNQSRSFCYVDDIVNGILLSTGNDKYYGPINLGNPEEISILELAKKIIKLSNSESMIQYLEARVDDPVRRKPDISKAKKLFGFEPKIGIDSGLDFILNLK